MEIDTVKLLGRLQARQRDPVKPKSEYADEEMQEAMKALIRKRHGLHPT